METSDYQNCEPLTKTIGFLVDYSSKVQKFDWLFGRLNQTRRYDEIWVRHWRRFKDRSFVWKFWFTRFSKKTKRALYVSFFCICVDWEIDGKTEACSIGEKWVWLSRQVKIEITFWNIRIIGIRMQKMS